MLHGYIILIICITFVLKKNRSQLSTVYGKMELSLLGLLLLLLLTFTSRKLCFGLKQTSSGIPQINKEGYYIGTRERRRLNEDRELQAAESYFNQAWDSVGQAVAAVETGCIKAHEHGSGSGSRSLKVKSGGSKSSKGSKGSTGSNDPTNSAMCDEVEDEIALVGASIGEVGAASTGTASDVSPCEAVALELLVTDLPGTTYTMDIVIVLSVQYYTETTAAGFDFGSSVRHALQHDLPATLTNCAYLQDGREPTNVVFGDVTISQGTCLHRL